MNRYLTALGAVHIALGALSALIGGAALLLTTLLGVSALYEKIRLLIHIITSAQFDRVGSQIEVTIYLLITIALMATPAVALIVSGGVGALGGYGIVRRRPLGRIVAMAWAVPSMIFGLPGLVFVGATFAVLLDADAQQEFASGGG